MKIPGGLGALRRTFVIRDYRLFVIGNFSSSVGLWTQRVAIGWLTWELTHSTAWLGGIAIAEAVPNFAFSLIAGTVVDRVNYFKLLRITQSFSLLYATVMAALTLTGLINIWVLVGLTVVRGTIMTFNRPSRLTVIYNLVGRDLIASAVALNAIIFNASRFIGPAIGGALIVAVGIGKTFTAAAFMFFVFTATLALMRPVVDDTPVAERRSMLAETIEGLRYIMAHPGIRVQMGIIVGVSILAKPITDLLPGFAGKVFATGPHGLALLMSAHGIGAMLGATYMASRGRGVQGMTGQTITGMLLIALCLILFVAVPAFWMALIAIGMVGFVFISQNVANQTLIQSAADQRMRGRTVSTYGLVNQGAPAIGTFVFGAVAEHVSLRAPVAAGAALCVVLWFWAWRKRRALAACLEVDPDTFKRSSRGNAKNEDDGRPL